MQVGVVIKPYAMILVSNSDILMEPITANEMGTDFQSGGSIKVGVETNYAGELTAPSRVDLELQPPGTNIYHQIRAKVTIDAGEASPDGPYLISPGKIGFNPGVHLPEKVTLSVTADPKENDKWGPADFAGIYKGNVILTFSQQ